MEKMALISYHDGHGDTCLRMRSVLRTEDREGLASPGTSLSHQTNTCLTPVCRHCLGTGSWVCLSSHEAPVKIFPALRVSVSKFLLMETAPVLDQGPR